MANNQPGSDDQQLDPEEMVTQEVIVAREFNAIYEGLPQGVQRKYDLVKDIAFGQAMLTSYLRFEEDIEELLRVAETLLNAKDYPVFAIDVRRKQSRIHNMYSLSES